MADVNYEGMREETPLGDVVITKRKVETTDGSEVYVHDVTLHPKDGKPPQELHSGSVDGHSAYTYLAGFATGAHLMSKAQG